VTEPLGLANGFVLRAVGDCIQPFPIAARADTDPGLAEVIALLRGATLAMGNLETSIVDLATPELAPRVVDDWCLSALPGVAADLAAMGFGVVARANNHAMDWGPAGMRETTRRLEAAGVAHAGAGERLASATAPVYVESTHGRVAVVSAYTMRRFDPDAALDPFGVVPGRPGVNGLRVQRVVEAPAGDVELIRRVAGAIDPDGQLAADGDDLRLDDTRFEEGPALAVRYEADPHDLERILRAVRLGAQHADLLVVTVHAHEEGADAATPPAYLQAFARACVDAGAGAFIGHGVHRLWPVEVYRDRPICYGIGNFVFSDVQEPVHEAMYRFAAPRLPRDATTAPTDADVNAAAMGPYFDDDRYFRSVIVEMTIDEGAPTTRLVPLDLRRGTRLSVRGLPRLADPGTAQEVLKHLDAMSAPLGTTVDADGRAIARPQS
jgi:poly-gamma-glutamate synthesis protein (capsule biosynthesis protein)